MVDIIHRVGIRAPIARVYEALATVEGVAGWWTRQATGSSEPGGTLELCFQHPGGKVIGTMAMEVVALDPGKRVHWRFHAGPEEWIGTDATFDLRREGDYTIVLFGHRNWRQAAEFTAHCSTKWATFLMSLKQLAETGTGRPSPDDVKIDDWN